MSPKDLEVAEQIGNTFLHTLANGDEVELVLYREACGNYFAIEPSYIEQEAGPLISPYANGELILDEDLDSDEEPETCPICTQVHDDDEEIKAFENHYLCPDCQHEWVDLWCSQPDDECPKCHKKHISPYASFEVPINEYID